MSKDIREACERLLDDLTNKDWASEPFGKDTATVVNAWLAGPAWHDRPTGPGLWVCVDEEVLNQVCPGSYLNLTEENLAEGASFHTKRVFGPIPQDE